MVNSMTADRTFSVRVFDESVSLLCFDSGCLIGFESYACFKIEPFYDDVLGGYLTDHGIASAILDGRRFVDTGMLP